MSTIVKTTVITADAAAKLLGISKQALYAGARNGEIPCQRVCRRYLFVLEALQEWLLKSTTAANSSNAKSRNARKD